MKPSPQDFLTGVRAVRGRRAGGSSLEAIEDSLAHLQHGTDREQAQHRGSVAAVLELSGSLGTPEHGCHREGVDWSDFLAALHGREG